MHPPATLRLVLALALGVQILPELHAAQPTPDTAAPPSPAPQKTRLESRLASLNELLRKNPDQISLLSQRGDCHLFLGRFRESVADFESMIALDPRLDAGHWRLGIAYHFNGQFEESSRQFAKYHAYDGRDRENGLWKFLADARLEGIPAARGRMLEYKAFDREPFPLLYDLFAGRTTADALFLDLEKRGEIQKPLVAFFAHYYCGLWKALAGEKKAARDHLAHAVEIFGQEQSETNGPGYMWQVARLHLETAGADFPTLTPSTTSQP